MSSFIYTQRVTALRDGGTYRMRVQMRWYGSDGKLMKVRTMRSGACKQPAPLPNLRISSIGTSPGAVSGTTSYMVTVQNDGVGDAGPVVVGLRVDGGTLSTARVPTLAAGQAASVRLTGPACTATLRADRRPWQRDQGDERDGQRLGRGVSRLNRSRCRVSGVGNGRGSGFPDTDTPPPAPPYGKADSRR